MSRAFDPSRFVGIPFVDGGRTLDGCDCYGLSRLVYADFGVDLPDFTVSCFDLLRIGQEIEQGRRMLVRLDSPQAPCLALLRICASTPPGVCDHVGVYVAPFTVLHTMKAVRSHLIRTDHPLWARKIEGFYRYAG